MEERLRAKVDAIPHEKKQALLDHFHAGKNLGEAKDLAGIGDTLTASQILLDNVESNEWIGTVAKQSL
jgi:hypothetical protein